MSRLIKRTAVRLLLFGIPFGLSYLATRPAPQVPRDQPVLVCAYPGDQPGEFRIELGSTHCPVETVPAAVAARPSLTKGSERINISF